VDGLLISARTNQLVTLTRISICDHLWGSTIFVHNPGQLFALSLGPSHDGHLTAGQQHVQRPQQLIMGHEGAKMQDPHWEFIVFLLCVGNHSNTNNTSSGLVAHKNLPFVLFVDCTRPLVLIWSWSPKLSQAESN
jgi:hypothetical protein